MHRTIKITTADDITNEYRNTPIGNLIEYHNLHKPYSEYSQAQLLIGMCMDNRKQLHLPENFAFVIRAGGANLKKSAFKVSYTIAIGGIKHIALIAHNHCAMVNLNSRKDQFIEGLVKNAGWETELAEEHFDFFAHSFEIENEIDFVIKEAARLRHRYPKITVAPLLYNVDDNRLYLVREG